MEETKTQELEAKISQAKQVFHDLNNSTAAMVGIVELGQRLGSLDQQDLTELAASVTSLRAGLDMLRRVLYDQIARGQQ